MVECTKAMSLDSCSKAIDLLYVSPSGADIWHVRTHVSCDTRQLLRQGHSYTIPTDLIWFLKLLHRTQSVGTLRRCARHGLYWVYMALRALVWRSLHKAGLLEREGNFGDTVDKRETCVVYPSYLPSSASLPDLHICLSTPSPSTSPVTYPPPCEQPNRLPSGANISTSYLECRPNARPRDAVPVELGLSVQVVPSGQSRTTLRAHTDSNTLRHSRSYHERLHSAIALPSTSVGTNILPARHSRLPSTYTRGSPKLETRDEIPVEASPNVDDVSDASSERPLCSRHRRFVAPFSLNRYDTLKYYNPVPRKISTLPAITTQFPHSTNLECGNWIPITHPEGALYFYDAQRHILTEAYVYDPAWKAEVEMFIDHLNTLLENEGKELPPNYDLVVELESSDVEDCVYWGYYYVNHDTRTIFWIEDLSMDRLMWAFDEVTSLAHLKHMLESEYWTHWALFPSNSQPFPKEVRQELLATLIQHASETLLMAGFAVSPFDSETLLRMISLVTECDIDSPSARASIICTIARLMKAFCNWRYHNSHGQRNARLARSRIPRLKQLHPRTALIKLVSPFLFWAPESRLSDIERFCVDDVVDYPQWTRFVSNLQTEWTGFVAYASILLTTNVAFLAIPSVVQDNNALNNSLAQIISDVSVVMSLGSIILGLMLIRKYRSICDTNADEASAFLLLRGTNPMGYEPMVIIHSLPYALLMWAMLTFLLAFLLFCFQGTGLSTRLPVGAASFSILILAMCCILAERRKRENARRSRFERTIRQMLTDAGEKASGLWEHVVKMLDRGRKASVIWFAGLNANGRYGRTAGAV